MSPTNVQAAVAACWTGHARWPMASVDTTRPLASPLRPTRPRLAASDRVAYGAISGGVLGGLAGLLVAGDADAIGLGFTVLGTTYSGLAGGGLVGWLTALARRGPRAPRRRARPRS